MFISFILPMIFLLLVIIIFLINIKVKYAFRLRDFQIYQQATVKILFFSKTIEIKPKPEQQRSLGELKAYRKIAKDAVANIDIPLFDANVTIGLNDAYLTAMTCGTARTVGSMALFYLLPENKLYLQKHIKIKPNFDRECLDIDLNCILLMNIANIIRVILQIISLKRSDKSASHRKHDENHDGRNP